jgi:hypothetical protein
MKCFVVQRRNEMSHVMLPFDQRRDDWSSTGNWELDFRVKLQKVHVDTIGENSFELAEN